MTDLATAGAIGATGVTGGVGVLLVPGVDPFVVLGAFAGAVFFITQARDPSFMASLGYLLSSWIFGFVIGGEVAARGLPITPPLAALVSSAVFVVLATGLIEWLKGGKAPFWFRFIPGLGGKKDG